MLTRRGEAATMRRRSPRHETGVLRATARRPATSSDETAVAVNPPSTAAIPLQRRGRRRHDVVPRRAPRDAAGTLRTASGRGNIRVDAQRRLSQAIGAPGPSARRDRWLRRTRRRLAHPALGQAWLDRARDRAAIARRRAGGGGQGDGNAPRLYI